MSYLELQRTLGHISQHNEDKKEETYQNKHFAFLHSFADKQQLHKMGNKYYLCDRKTIRHP